MDIALLDEYEFILAREDNDIERIVECRVADTDVIDEDDVEFCEVYSNRFCRVHEDAFF